MYELTVNGSCFERGTQHGEEFKSQIKELFEIRRDLIENYWGRNPNLPKNTLSLKDLCEKHLGVLQKDQDLWQEFDGISQASKLNHVDLMILNNYTDLRDFTLSPQGETNDEGCSIIYVKNSKKRIVGQTWDMHGSAAPYNLHLTDAEEGCELLTICGCLALCGLNRYGVSVFITNMHARDHKIGLSWPMLVRKMLRSQSVDGALGIMKTNPPSSGHNYCLADKDKVVDVETTGGQIDIIFKSGQDDEHFFHTNHYLGQLKKHESIERQSKTTHKRYETLEKYFSDGSSSFDFNQFSNGVLEGKSHPGIYIPTNSQNEHASITCSGIWVDYTEKSLSLYSYRPENEDYKKVSWS